jgi:hypothetical protein
VDKAQPSYNNTMIAPIWYFFYSLGEFLEEICVTDLHVTIIYRALVPSKIDRVGLARENSPIPEEEGSDRDEE